MNEMKLTLEQVASMSSDSPWLKATPEQEQFIQACPESEVITLYDNAFIRVPKERLEAAYETAFKAAAHEAANQLGIRSDDSGASVHDFSVEPPELGQAYLRVTVTTKDGRQASAVGMLPDPRLT